MLSSSDEDTAAQKNSDGTVTCLLYTSSADVPDFHFHGNGVRTAECISAAVRLFPQEAKTADAVCRSGLACEKKNSGKSADFPEF